MSHVTTEDPSMKPTSAFILIAVLLCSTYATETNDSVSELGKKWKELKHRLSTPFRAIQKGYNRLVEKDEQKTREMMPQNVLKVFESKSDNVVSQDVSDLNIAKNSLQEFIWDLEADLRVMSDRLSFEYEEVQNIDRFKLREQIEEESEPEKKHALEKVMILADECLELKSSSSKLEIQIESHKKRYENIVQALPSNNDSKEFPKDPMHFQRCKAKVKEIASLIKKNIEEFNADYSKATSREKLKCVDFDEKQVRLRLEAIEKEKKEMRYDNPDYLDLRNEREELEEKVTLCLTSVNIQNALQISQSHLENIENLADYYSEHENENQDECEETAAERAARLFLGNAISKTASLAVSAVTLPFSLAGKAWNAIKNNTVINGLPKNVRDAFDRNGELKISDRDQLVRLEACLQELFDKYTKELHLKQIFPVTHSYQIEDENIKKELSKLYKIESPDAETKRKIKDLEARNDYNIDVQSLSRHILNVKEKLEIVQRALNPEKELETNFTWSPEAVLKENEEIYAKKSKKLKSKLESKREKLEKKYESMGVADMLQKIKELKKMEKAETDHEKSREMWREINKYEREIDKLQEIEELDLKINSCDKQLEKVQARLSSEKSNETNVLNILKNISIGQKLSIDNTANIEKPSTSGANVQPEDKSNAEEQSNSEEKALESEIRSKLGFEPACTADVLQKITPKCLSALSNLFVFESETSDSDIASLFAQINPIALTVLDAALYDKLGLKPSYFARMTRTQMYQLPVIQDLGKLSSAKLKEEQSKHICHKVNAENVDFTHLAYTDSDRKARYPSSFKEWCRRSDSTKLSASIITTIAVLIFLA